MRKFFLSFLLALGILAMLEIGVRLIVEPPSAGVLLQRPILELYPGVERAGDIFSEVTPEALDWAPYEHWVMRPSLRGRFFRTNSLGLRGNETAVEKPAGRFRIAVLGGSAAWGLGASGDAKTVPGQLETILAKKHPDRDIEVLNAAQIGYVSTQELIYFQRVISPMQPDVVVLLDGYNDISADLMNAASGWPQNASLLRSRYQASWKVMPARYNLDDLLRPSRLLAAISDALPDRSVSPSPPPEISAEDTARTYIGNVGAIARIAAPAPVWVALQPSLIATTKPLTEDEQHIVDVKEGQVPRYRARVAEAHSAMLLAVQAAGFPFIPLDDSLGTEPTLMFADECHFGDNGAKRIASRIAARLSESF